MVKQVEDRLVKVEVGSVVEHGGSGRVERLLCCDWEGAPFRWPNPIPEWHDKHAIAVRVEITGRTFRKRASAYWVRVRLVFVGDGEPDTECGGWLKVDPWECERVERPAVATWAAA